MSTARATSQSPRRPRTWLTSAAISALLALASRPAAGGPGPVPSLRVVVADSQVIVAGVFLGTTRQRGADVAHFLPQVFLKGSHRPGTIDIDLSRGVPGVAGESEIAFLRRQGGRYVPATVNDLLGHFAFLPAEATGGAWPYAASPLAFAARATGAFLADEHASASRRRLLLDLLCEEPLAAPYLVSASGSPVPAIRFGAIGCRIEQGDLRPLRKLAGESAASAPLLPASADRAAGALESIRNPEAIPALLEMARDAQPAFRLAALNALWPNHPPAAAAVPVYRKALLDGTVSEQNAAVQGLITLARGTVADYDYFLKHRQKVIAEWLKRTAPEAH